MQRTINGLLLVACLSLFVLQTISLAQEKPITKNVEHHDWLRGSGDDLEIRLRGTVKSATIEPVREISVSVTLYDYDKQTVFKATMSDSRFEVWLPVNRVRWYRVELAASGPNGQLALEFLDRNELRQAAIDGVELELSEPDVIKTIVVSRDGVRIANANVRAVTDESREIRGVTSTDGSTRIGLKANENLGVLTAWTHDKFIGGYQFWRLPKRDPKADEHVIDLISCRSHFIHAMDEQGMALPNLRFNLIAATASNSIPSPDELAVSTDDKGQAEYAWFPQIENANHSIQLKSDGWLIADQKKEERQTTLVLKPATKRKRIEGKVTNPHGLSAGISVFMESPQIKIQNRGEIFSVTTDQNGRFFMDVLPNAFYSTVVNDSQWVSEAVDFVPFSDSDKIVNEPELSVSKGYPVQIVVMSGVENRPLEGVNLVLHTEYSISWIEKGKIQFGQTSGRRLYNVTDKDGRVEVLAPEGKLNVYASKDDWQAKEHIVVLGDLLNRLEIHREVDAFIDVAGRLVAPEGMVVDLTRATIKFGAIDGKSRDKGNTESIASGKFKLKTNASKLGIYASTIDGQASGATIISDLSKPVVLQLHPKRAFSERLLTADGEPLGNQKVLARIFVRFVTKQGDVGRFEAEQFQAITNENGVYTFSSLPCSTQIELLVEPIFQFNTSQQYLGVVSLRSDGQPPNGLSELRRPKKSENMVNLPSISERFNKLERDCQSKGLHLMLIVRDAADKKGVKFVDDFLESREEGKLGPYLWLKIDSKEITNSENAPIVQSLDWPTVESGKVFLCTYDSKGREIGRFMLDLASTAGGEQINAFFVRHAPPPQDANKK